MTIGELQDEQVSLYTHHSAATSDTEVGLTELPACLTGTSLFLGRFLNKSFFIASKGKVKEPKGMTHWKVYC